MAPLGPFEREPRIGVAVSGGADSMALTLLAARWAEARRGKLLALTIDHGLRPESAAEAARVAAWLAARGIAHAVLPWIEPKPVTGIQAAAREARYRLLLARCRTEGILHLLVAHHRDDQAETVAQRRAQKSGAAGLAAMAAITPTLAGRLLRPLLTVPKARLQATLESLGQAWLEDPSNLNTAFLRVRTRASLAGTEGSEALAMAAEVAAAGRAVLERDAADLLARAATVSPAGFIVLDRRRLAAADEVIGPQVLALVLRTVGGAHYPPRRERLARLWGEIRLGLDRRRSLAGCLVSPSRHSLLIYREPAAAETIRDQGSGLVHWDGRFLLLLDGPGRVAIGPLGRDRGGLARGLAPAQRVPPWPAAVVSALPALFDGDGVAVVPHFAWRRKGFAGPVAVSWAFAPASPLTGGLVWHRRGTMC